MTAIVAKRLRVKYLPLSMPAELLVSAYPQGDSRMKMGLVASILVLSVIGQQAQGCDMQTGERVQRVVLDWNHQHIDTWAVEDTSVHSVDLPNGVKLGVQIEASRIYKSGQSEATFKYAPEMVRISLFDMSGTEPKRLTSTYGGSNSIQGFGAQGGADSVAMLGNPGVQLTLLKPVCEAVEQSGASDLTSTLNGGGEVR